METKNEVDRTPNGVTEPPKQKGNRLLIFGGIAAAIVVVLALALGLGLGLGLRKSSSSDASPLTTTTPSSTPSLSTSYKANPADYVLSPSFNTQAANTTRYYTFNLTELPDGAPDGVAVRMLLINGQFPGPLVEVNEGDRIVCQVNNFMTVPTTIHWHGQYQNGTNFMDGTSGISQCPIQPNSTYTYNFTFTQSGTYWYHAHWSTTYQDGLFGPLIIHGRDEPNYNVDGDMIMMVDDWYHDFSLDLLPGFFAPGNEGVEPVPDNGLINGLNVFDCDNAPGYTCDNSTDTYATFNITTGGRYRFRVINTGAFADFKISIDNHSMEVLSYTVPSNIRLFKPMELHWNQLSSTLSPSMSLKDTISF